MNEDPIFKEKMALAVIRHGYPLTFFEDRRNQEMMAYLNPNLKPLSRKETVANCLDVFEKERTKLKHALGSIPGRLCLTCDIWVDPCTREYLCLTVNYVDSNWKLQSKFLHLARLPFPRDASILRSEVYNLLCKWGIEKKVFSITSDSRRCGDTVQDMLRDFLNEQDGALLCNGDYLHVRCGAHFMDQMAQACFKLIDRPIRNKLLKPLNDMANLFLRTEHPTANSYFINVLNIGLVLVDALEDKDLEISNLARTLKSEFDVYWDACNEVLALAIIFDPRYKLSFVKFCYEKLDKESAENRYLCTRRRLGRLFKTYSDQVFASQMNEMKDDTIRVSILYVLVVSQ